MTEENIIKNKAYKFLLLPNQEQRSLINQTFGCVRFVYNKMLEERSKIYENNKHDKALLQQQKLPTPAKYKKDFPFLKLIDSLSLANAQQHLNRAFANFFDKRAKYPRFKSKKHNKASFTTNNINNSISFENGLLKLPKIGLVKLK